MKDITFSIKDISTYRSELMGWAILWIMMLHFTFTQIKPLGFIAQYGFAGVDIFLFVSGFGLFYSLDKGNSILIFYRKRLIRIFPTYYIIGIFASIFLFGDNLLTYLFRYSTIGFWTGGVYWEWYIPSLVVLYIMSPLLKFLIDKRFFYIIGVILACIFGLAFYYIVQWQDLDRSHFFFIYRIPVYIYGMICAYWIKEGFSKNYYFIFLTIGIVLFIFLFPLHHQLYRYKYFSLLFLFPCFTLFFTLISKYVKIFNYIMSKMGKASLEIYLIQGIFFTATLRETISVPPAWHDTLTIGLIIISSLLGISVHWLIEKSGIHRLL